MAHLLIIELPGGNDTDIIQAAIDGGHEFTFLSGQLDHYQQQPLVNAILGRALEQVEVAPFDYTEVESRVLAIHSKHPIDAVLCLIDTRIIETAHLASRLGVRHLNPESATLLRDKYSVRCRLAERGLSQPPFKLATSNEEIKVAVEELGLPVVIKPVDGYGSQNIVVLRYLEDIDPLMSPLEDLLPCRTDYGLGVVANDRMLVERYMTGTVIGCDTLTINGRHQLLGIHEKVFFESPSFAIRGGSFTPNRLELAAIERYTFSVLEAVEFDWGAAHTELMITHDGLHLIEINPRLVGAKMPRLIGYALSHSIHASLIDVHLGKSSPTSSISSEMVAVSRWIVADHAGILEHIELPKWQDDRIRCVELLKRPGDYVRPPFENSDRIGYVMICSPTREEAEQLADEFVAQTIVTTR